MFDFSFGEMLVVGLVALVVLGPERLPKAARFVGLWVRRARAQWYSVKSELERELASEELRRGLADGKQVMRETEAHLRATDAEIRTAVSDTAAEVRAPIVEVDATAEESPVQTPAESPAKISPVTPADTARQDTNGQ
jgi:sec-independent protein translocase protein TatB